MKPRNTILLSVFIIAAVFAADQFTKHLVRTNMRLGQAIPAPDAFATIRYTLNDGVAFSMLEGHRSALIVLQLCLVLAIIIVMLFLCRKSATPLMVIAFSLMLGGGIGNLVDRILFGQVTDFISVGSFAIFNVADACLTTGCGLMLLFVILYDRSERRKLKAEEAAEAEEVEEAEKAAQDSGPVSQQSDEMNCSE
jgi:signal peptidase II